jgi:hypothetical protein
MTRHPKRRNPNGASGNKPSPRRGEKSKQNKVSNAKETEPKVVQQTKLTFADPPTPNSQISAPTATATATAITPDIPKVARILKHPTPPTTPDRQQQETTTHTTTQEIDSEDDRKPAATNQKNDTPKQTKTATTTTQNPQEPTTANHLLKTPPPPVPQATPPPVPQALQTPSRTYREIRYNGQIERARKVFSTSQKHLQNTIIPRILGHLPR